MHRGEQPCTTGSCGGSSGGRCLCRNRFRGTWLLQAPRAFETFLGQGLPEIAGNPPAKCHAALDRLQHLKHQAVCKATDVVCQPIAWPLSSLYLGSIQEALGGSVPSEAVALLRSQRGWRLGQCLGNALREILRRAVQETVCKRAKELVLRVIWDNNPANRGRRALSTMRAHNCRSRCRTVVACFSSLRAGTAELADVQ